MARNPNPNPVHRAGRYLPQPTGYRAFIPTPLPPDPPVALTGEFKNENELQTIWSAPDTRAKLLAGLAENGFGPEQLKEMQRIVDAENSDLFDVLAYISYALPKLTRVDRASAANEEISEHYNSKQQAFLAFVLSHYVREGVQELDQSKLRALLRIRYNDSIHDAIADLGRPEEIGKIFAGFQQFLYKVAN